MSTYKYLWDSVLADILYRAGFRGDGLIAAFGVVQGESAGDPYCTNYNGEGVPQPVEDADGDPVLDPDGDPAMVVEIPAHPAKGWFPGGESHDIGLCQISDYWHLADPSSVFYCKTRAEALRNAYNPLWSVERLFVHTEGGTKNWSTWIAYRNGDYADPEFIERATEAEAKTPLAQTYHDHTVGGATALVSSSIPGRCNPPMSWDRYYHLNRTIKEPVVKPDGTLTYRVVPNTPSYQVKPRTDLRVGYTTTRLAAGRIPGVLY